MSPRVPRKACLLLVLFAAFCAGETEARKWTDSSGQFSIDAEFVEFVEGQVVLKRSDGRIIRLPFERLSAADQQHVRSLTASVPPSLKPSSKTNTPLAPPPSTTTAEPADPSSDDDVTQTVVAEGVGLTPEDALKDAFRAAVRQVVGEVVDAETLVKNDEIVRDQILTYSDGFVPQHTKLSEKSEGGLFRITIRAVVERRKMEVRLRAANVSLRNVDGQSLFGNIVSQLENEKDAAALLKAALEGFPKNCLEIRVVGVPLIVHKDEQKATLRFVVELKPDLPAYKSFAERLKKTLQSIARDRGEFVLTFNRAAMRDVPQSEYLKLELKGRGMYRFLPLCMPKSFTSFDETGRGARYRENVLTVAAATHATTSGEQLGLSYYVLDKSVQPVVVDAASRRGQGQITLLNSLGETLIVDRFALSDPRGARIPFDGSLIAGLAPPPPGFDGLYDRANSRSRIKVDSLTMFFFAPVFFGSEKDQGTLSYKPALLIVRDLTLTLEEIKTLDKVKCEVQFQ